MPNLLSVLGAGAQGVRQGRENAEMAQKASALFRSIGTEESAAFADLLMQDPRGASDVVSAFGGWNQLYSNLAANALNAQRAAQGQAGLDLQGRQVAVDEQREQREAEQDRLDREQDAADRAKADQLRAAAAGAPIEVDPNTGASYVRNPVTGQIQVLGQPRIDTTVSKEAAKRAEKTAGAVSSALNKLELLNEARSIVGERWAGLPGQAADLVGRPFGGEQAQLSDRLRSIHSELTLENMQTLKGAMSDKEWKNIEKIAGDTEWTTKGGQLAIYDRMERAIVNGLVRTRAEEIAKATGISHAAAIAVAEQEIGLRSDDGREAEVDALPPGSKRVGTSANGNPLWETPDGRQFEETP